MRFSNVGHDNAKDGNLRGFVGFIALALWFLIAILSMGRASAEGLSLTARDILPSIEATLVSYGAPADASIQLDHPEQKITDSAIAYTSYNPLSGRFVIRVANDATAITGAARRVERYAVVNRAIDRGDIIAAADISYVETAAATPRGYVTDADALEGKMARRALAANRPIRESDIETPKLVEKGAIVTLTYQIDGLRMSHQGVAMHDGAEGDIVSVQNIHSDRTLKGLVSDRNLVTVIPARAAF